MHSTLKAHLTAQLSTLTAQCQDDLRARMAILLPICAAISPVRATPMLHEISLHMIDGLKRACTPSALQAVVQPYALFTLLAEDAATTEKRRALKERLTHLRAVLTQLADLKTKYNVKK